VRWLVPVAAAAAFLAGSQFAGGAPKANEAIRTLQKRQKMLHGDLRKIEQAVKDIVELREMRESGKYILNHEEKKLERKSRTGFHIFMERYRNGTLGTLQIYERLLRKQDYVDPLRRFFGRSLDEIVQVKWDEEAIEDIVGEIADGYNVQLNIGGSLDYRKTISLEGEMSVLAILLYIENIWDAELIVKNDKLWFVHVKTEAKTIGEDDE